MNYWQYNADLLQIKCCFFLALSFQSKGCFCLWLDDNKIYKMII